MPTLAHATNSRLSEGVQPLCCIGNAAATIVTLQNTYINNAGLAGSPAGQWALSLNCARAVKLDIDSVVRPPLHSYITVVMHWGRSDLSGKLVTNSGLAESMDCAHNHKSNATEVVRSHCASSPTR